jgi:hypothetical protein
MANRDTRFLIKRSNVPGKIPTNGDLLLGELGLNTADAILYTSGTTANTILPIGWDRVARTGDTMTGGLFTTFLSATTVSATTYLNLPVDIRVTGASYSNNTFTYTNNTGGTFNVLFNSVTGLTVNGILSATTISGDTIYANSFPQLPYTDGETIELYVDISGNTLVRVKDIVSAPSGGTRTFLGNVNITSGLTANTISATTYYNLPVFTGDYLPLSGGTVYGPTIYSSGLTANTLNVTGLTQTSGITSTGGITFKQVTIDSAYTATTSDYMIDASGGTFTVSLPSAGGIQGRLLVIKNNGGGAITVDPYNSETIDDKPFVILGETNSIQLVSNGFNWVALGYNISTVNSSTGVFEFTGITTASPTTFTVAPVKGWIVDDTTNPLSPQLYYVSYSGGTHTATYVTTATETWIYLTSGGTISQSNIPLTDQERRQNIFLGKLGHANKTSIINSFSQPDFVLSPLSQLRDMFNPIGFVNGGIRPSPNGVNLSFNTSAGYLHGLGINFGNDILNPNAIYVTGTSPCTFQYRTQTGGTASNTTLVDPTKYDVGGVVTSLSGTKATNQRIYLVQNGVFRVQYGQTEYSNLTQAIAGISSENFVEFSNFENNGILVGILSVLSSATDLTDTSKAQFFNVSKFGDSAGAAGGSATTTLQQAYNNSTTPEITTNSLLGALSVKNGTGNADNVTRLFEGQTGTNGVTSVIYADGYISGTTLHTSGFTANSTGISATTVSATTIFTSGFTANTTGLSATTVSATTYYNLPSDTLQQVYTASTAPRITTNNTLGSLRVRGGTGTDTDNNFIIENNVGDVTSYWAANGNLFLQSLTGTTINATGDINGFSLVSTQSINDEGGELRLAKAQTNTTLSGSQITVDIYQNKFRIFESGGSNRGVYIDLTAASAGVGTNLLSGGGGEVNTASNLGSGTGLFAQKVSADLQFKTLTSTGGTVTLSNNSTTVNLEVVPASNFTGGTVTGATNFTNSLSANSISATTYYNLPQGTYVTGGTYTEGITTFTNTTGGTFNVTSTTTYAAGVISGSTGWSSTGTGQINLPNVKVALYNNANNIEPILIYDVASGTTNSGGIPALANNDTNYIVIEYNGGSPIYNVYDNDSIVNDSSVVLFMVVYRADNFIHTLEFGNQGAGLANKLNDRFIMTDRIGYESGLALGLSGSTGIVTSTAGVAWNGPNRQFLDPVNSQDDIFFKSFHSGGTWVYTTTGDTLNNTYYDDGTDIVLATAGKYLTNWYFRGQEINDHLYEVYSTNQYDSVALAQLSTEPVLPELITSHAILLGRIIVQVNATTGLTESAFTTPFQPTQVAYHNDLNGIQGGSAGQYYHLNANQYNNIALTNVDNNFSVGQTFNAGITANTISATTVTANSSSLVSMSATIISGTTISGGTIYGDGSNITNIPVPYGIINAFANFNFLT